MAGKHLSLINFWCNPHTQPLNLENPGTTFCSVILPRLHTQVPACALDIHLYTGALISFDTYEDPAERLSITL